MACQVDSEITSPLSDDFFQSQLAVSSLEDPNKPTTASLISDMRSGHITQKTL